MELNGKVSKTFSGRLSAFSDAFNATMDQMQRRVCTARKKNTQFAQRSDKQGANFRHARVAVGRQFTQGVRVDSVVQ